MLDGFFRTDWALEVRRIGDELANESRQALDLFRSGWGECISKIDPDVSILKKQEGDKYNPRSDPPPPNPG